MANYRTPLLVLAIFLLITTTYPKICLFSSAANAATATGEFDLNWIHARLPGSGTCHGSIAECMANSNSDEEFNMDSEINRRILATNNYISYEALRRNSVPCSQRGASYYNCRAGAQANPYNRGCSAITRCRN